MDNIAIGKKIKELRLLAGLTQEGLAEELGVTFQQVQKYERAATKINLMRLQQIAVTLNIPVSSFFDASSYAVSTLSEEESKLLKAFRRVSPTLRSSVVDIVTGLAEK